MKIITEKKIIIISCEFDEFKNTVHNYWQQGYYASNIKIINIANRPDHLLIEFRDVN